MSILINKSKLKLKDDLKKGIEKFVRSASRELFDAGYHSFYFQMKKKDKAICLYLYYDLDLEDSEKILSWQIYLQEKLNKIIKKIKLEKFDWVVLIIESGDLWEANNDAEEKTKTEDC